MGMMEVSSEAGKENEHKRGEKFVVGEVGGYFVLFFYFEIAVGGVRFAVLSHL